ncbi:hypothetical protein LPJ56_005615, partial [Coemansia sp. RSA 2599]
IVKGDEKLSDTAATSKVIDPGMFGNDSVNSSDTSKNSSSSSSSTNIDDMRFLKPIQKPIAGKDAQHAPRFRRESEMYPAIASLFRLVERLICKFAILQDSTQKTSPSQSVKVYEKADVGPKDSDNYLHIDLGLFISDMWKHPAFNDRAMKHNKGPEIGAADPKYADIFAIVKAKISEDDQVDAYKQLLLYTYSIYWHQHDCRFAWGLTVCDTAIRACVFGNDGFLASDKMDLSEADGRSAFIGLLVNMAYCGREQLGFDPTIRYNSVRSMWEIDVFNDSDSTKTTCEIVSVMQAAERIFGRHTRCFRCKLPDDENGTEKNNDSDSDSDSNGLGHFIVKDAWAYAEGDPDSPGFRDEVSVLRSINEQLGADASFEGTIPKLHWGGVVRITGQDGVALEDKADPLFQILSNEDSANHRRVHKRLAMGPIGEPLRMVRSVDELIVVVADAMEAHNAILERCGILHRDISTNNILINRSQGSVRGMLIDFDCAVRTDASDKT